jgi:hypothetical protein
MLLLGFAGIGFMAYRRISGTILLWRYFLEVTYEHDL